MIWNNERGSWATHCTTPSVSSSWHMICWRADKRRVVEKLESQAEALREEAQRRFAALVQRHMQDNRGIVDRAAIQCSLDTALPDFFEAKLTEFAAEFRRSVEAILSRQQQRADALTASVRATTASLFEIALPQQEAPEPFRLGPEPYWVSERLVHALIPSPIGLLRRMLPAPCDSTICDRYSKRKSVASCCATWRACAGRHCAAWMTRSVASPPGSTNDWPKLSRQRRAASGKCSNVVEIRRGRRRTELARLGALESRLRVLYRG